MCGKYIQKLKKFTKTESRTTDKNGQKSSFEIKLELFFFNNNDAPLEPCNIPRVDNIQKNKDLIIRNVSP